jgi:hypothetical protein
MFGLFKKLPSDPVTALIDQLCEGRLDNRFRCINYFRNISYNMNDSCITRDWTEIISTIGTILVDGVGRLADHFLIQKDGAPVFDSRSGTSWRCVISDETLLTGPLFDIKDGTYHVPFSVMGSYIQSKSLAEQLRCIGYKFTLYDSSDIKRVAEMAAQMVNMIKRANRLLTDSPLIVREYCYVDFNAGRVLFQKVTPERVDAIYDALVASNGGSKPEFINEYRKYIIRELALKSQSNPSYAQMDIEYDWPEVTVPVYPDFAAEQMESIKAKRAADETRKTRDAMNAKYKKVIDEISSCRTDLS